MKKIKKILFIIFLVPSAAWAFKDKAFSVGLGYYSQNILNKTVHNAAGETSFLGVKSLPLNIKYDISILKNWFVAPQFSYTLIPRKSEGDSAKVTLAHLAFLFGKNVQDSNLDWYFGPGILQQTYDGAGGSVQLLNGSTPTTFYLPSRKTTSRKITLNFGASYSFFNTRLGLDLIFENAFSSNKRSESLMLSYAYTFSNLGIVKN